MPKKVRKFNIRGVLRLHGCALKVAVAQFSLLCQTHFSAGKMRPAFFNPFHQ
jgi:hypothetical protein